MANNAKQKICILIAVGLLLAVIAVTCWVTTRPPSNYEGFAKVMSGRPRSYEDLEALVKQHIYNYSPKDKRSFLSDLRPLPASRIKDITEQGGDIVYYPHNSIESIKYSCSVHTFQTDQILFFLTIQSRAQEHVVYFDSNSEIVGYESEWLK